MNNRHRDIVDNLILEPTLFDYLRSIYNRNLLIKLMKSAARFLKRCNKLSLVYFDVEKGSMNIHFCHIFVGILWYFI